MRAAIYNPYLDTLGGGERYTLSFANVLNYAGYTVDIEWPDPGIIKKLENRFGMSLKNINIISDINRGDGYDLCFWVSDGSIPALKSRKNFLHFQVPFTDVNGNTLINKMKLFRINQILVNSNFTKSVIDREYGVKSRVLYPPVPIDQIRPLKKDNIIFYVGRFSKLAQNKHQDILVEAFKKFFDKGNNNWKMVLAGGTEIGSDEILASLRENMSGYPIELSLSPVFKTLKEMYGRSKMFWSASGFGEDQDLNPSRVEHFGINIVEALSAGSVPLAFNAGGHKEIIKSGENGYLWSSIDELVELTENLTKDVKLYKKISANSIKSSKQYGYKNFESEVLKLL